MAEQIAGRSLPGQPEILSLATLSMLGAVVQSTGSAHNIGDASFAQNLNSTNQLQELDLPSATSLLLDVNTGRSVKKQVVKFLVETKCMRALDALSKALWQYKEDKDLALYIAKAIRRVKAIGPLSAQNVKNHSIIGTVWRAVEEFGLDREAFELVVDNPYDSLTLKFAFPTEAPFYRLDGFIDSLEQLFSEKRVRVDIKSIVNPQKTEGAISLKMEINMSNLTAFWNALGATYDFQKNYFNFYRAFTYEEMIQKLEERAKTFLDGVPDKNSDEYRNFALYIFGDGTPQNPGLINILRNSKDYEALQFIKVESNKSVCGPVGFRRCDNRTSLKEITRLGEYNPYFDHYLTEGDIQRWIYLASAGSIFTTALLEFNAWPERWVGLYVFCFQGYLGLFNGYGY